MEEERLHKMVNGEKIYLSPEEDIEMKNLWKRNDEKKKMRREEEMKSNTAFDTALDKLMLNMTEAEKVILKDRLCK